MIRVPKSIILLFSMLSIFRLQGQESQSFSLQQAREYALQHNINVENAQLDVEKSKKKVWETTAIGLPQVNSSLSYNNNIDLPTQLIPGEFFGQPGQFVEVQFGTQHNATASVSANQLVFSGPYIIGLQASKTFLTISEQQRVKTNIETKHSVTQAYYSILVASENVKVLEKSRKNLEDLLSETKATFEQGLVDETAVDQMQINLSNVENQINMLERQVEVGKALLKFHMGMPAEANITLSDSLLGILDQIKLKDVAGQQFDVNMHIDYKIINTQEQANVLQMRREKTEYLPTISAFYSHQQNAMREKFNYFESNDDKWFESNVVGLQIDMPIFSSGSRLSKVQQAQIELEKTQNMKRQVEQSLKMNVKQARTEYMSALEKYYTQKSSLELSQKIYDRSMKQFKAGMSSSNELTQNHNQMLNTQSAYFQAIFELLNSKNKLDKALNNY